MFKTEGDVWKVTRANIGTLTFSIPGYSFKKGDTLEFRVYEKEALDQLPIKTKEIIIQEDCDSVDIYFSTEDTNIGEPNNEMVEYWYEIELNDNYTVMGYDDETGPKVLELYPKGVENNDKR